MDKRIVGVLTVLAINIVLPLLLWVLVTGITPVVRPTAAGRVECSWYTSDGYEAIGYRVVVQYTVAGLVSYDVEQDTCYHD